MSLRGNFVTFHLVLVPSVLMLTACSGGSSTLGASPGEDRALNDAAASLDANAADTNAAAINEEHPQ